MATATLVDLNPRAVRFARLNARLNGLEDRVEVLQGDMYNALYKRDMTRGAREGNYHNDHAGGQSLHKSAF